MKRLYLTIIILTTLTFTTISCARQPSSNISNAPVNSDLERALETNANNVQVEGEGIVERLLSDDNEGSRHQRFILRLPSGQTVLILHNIDLAPRVTGLQNGDTVRFYGEYIWNAQGGKIHWTHHDPQGHHVAGWIKHNGQTYQ